jgi:hypothetical protein
MHSIFLQRNGKRARKRLNAKLAAVSCSAAESAGLTATSEF